MNMARQYRNPPIVEGAFDARFEQGAKWNLGALGLLYRELIDEYPAEPRQLAAGAVEAAVPQDDESGAVIRLAPQRTVIEFATEERHYLIRAGGSSLTVHVMAPYTGWAEFRSRIAKVVDTYIRVAEPKSLSRLGIRYINKVDLGTGPVELSEYFRIPVETADSQGFTLGAFFVRTESVRENEQVRLIQSFASVPGDTAQFVLDIDVIQDNLGITPMSFQALSKQIDSLRDIERDVFEASITDKLRRTFGGYANDQ